MAAAGRQRPGQRPERVLQPTVGLGLCGERAFASLERTLVEPLLLALLGDLTLELDTLRGGEGPRCLLQLLGGHLSGLEPADLLLLGDLTSLCLRRLQALLGGEQLGEALLRLSPAHHDDDGRLATQVWIRTRRGPGRTSRSRSWGC